MKSYVCTNCGYRSVVVESSGAETPCPSCGSNSLQPEESPQPDPAAAGAAPEAAAARPVMAKDLPAAAAESRRLQLSFAGTAGEYFKIWIVNTFLTVITLGIYSAWAKVRTRRYFYRSTLLDGHTFDYTASPIALLKGRLIIAAWVGLYSLVNALNPLYSFAFMLLFYVGLPLLIYKSLKFSLHNTMYRNVRLRFTGTLSESYTTFLLFPFLIPFTLGIIYPYWAFRRKKYVFANLAYGATQSTFTGRPGPFYKSYLAAFGGGVLSFIVVIGIIGVFAGLARLADSAGPTERTSAAMGIATFPLLTLMFLYIGLAIYAWSANYCWAHTTLGSLQFKSALKGKRLFWIVFSSFVAIIFSLGLLIPWAKVRYIRYILSNTTVSAAGSMDEFAAAAEADVNAVGDAATDFFDVDIGL